MHTRSKCSAHSKQLPCHGIGAVTFGGEILKGLGRQDASASRAASVLTVILDGNEVVKKQLLRVTVNQTPHHATPPSSLLSHCITALSSQIYTPGTYH